LFFFGGCALAENQLSNFFNKGAGGPPRFSSILLALVVGQLRKPIARSFKNFAISRKYLFGQAPGQFLASQQLGNIGLRNIGGGRQIFLLKPNSSSRCLITRQTSTMPLHVSNSTD